MEISELLSYQPAAAEVELLLAEVSEAEVHKIMKSFPSNKAPGSDGYTAKFFKHSWSVTGTLVGKAIKEFFEKGMLLMALNATWITLVPNMMANFKPISCCNVLYKCITMILVNRIKQCLPKMISKNQSAFIQGRRIGDNILLAQEVVKNYHLPNRIPKCAITIDITKAFDSINWVFLHHVMQAFALPPRFIQWIMACISSPSYSVIVNGRPNGFFLGMKGLRQVDPLSPYLFIMCTDILSRFLDAVAIVGTFAYHPKCSSLALTHLIFTDDLIIFTEETEQSLNGIKSVLDSFFCWSGLRVSFEKCEAFLCGVPKELVGTLIGPLGIRRSLLPVKYLGVPSITGKLSFNHYQPLVEKITERISLWGCQTSYVCKEAM